MDEIYKLLIIVAISLSAANAVVKPKGFWQEIGFIAFAIALGGILLMLVLVFEQLTALSKDLEALMNFLDLYKHILLSS